MLVKLDMTINECREQYQILSKQIFRKDRPLWRRIFGSDISKYSASRLQTAVEGLLSRKNLPDDLSLRCSSQKNKMIGYVLSLSRSKYENMLTRTGRFSPTSYPVLRQDFSAPTNALGHIT